MIHKTLADIKQRYTDNPNLIQSIYLFCLFVSVFIFSPLINVVLDLTPNVKEFSNHIISNASVKDFDIASRIQLYFLAFLLIVFSSIALSVLLFKLLDRRYTVNDNNNKALLNIRNFSLIGIAAVFAGFFVANVDVVLFFIVGLNIYLLISTTQSKRYWDKENAFWILTTAIPFSLIVFKIIQNVIPPEKHQSLLKIEGTNFPLYNLGLVFCFLMLVITVGLSLFLKNYFKAIDSEEAYTIKRNQLYSATIPISCIVIAQSLLLEFFNVLNVRYNYLFNSPRLLFVLVGVAAIGCSVLLYYRKSKKGVMPVNSMGSYHFPLLIVGITMMIVQPWRIFQPENEFFEFANHGLAVDHFFRYGSLPIIENYDAHMFSNQLFAYLYGFTNGYEPWAPFLYVNFIQLIYSVMIYFVFRKILGSKTALIFLLCFPIMGLVINSFTMLCLGALSLHRLVSNPSRKSFYWFWLSVLFTCLFRLDLGFSTLLGGIFGYLTISFLLRKTIDWKRLIITGSVSFASALGLFVLLCLIKGVHPIMRLKEFLTISSSNQNWAYQSVGDTSHIAFRICYYFLPLLLVLLFVNIILKSWIRKDFIDGISANRKNQSAFVFFIFFAMAYFFNLPRGIVRHSYLENILTVVVSCLPLALLCFIYIKKRKDNLVFFLTVFTGLYVLTGLNEKSYKDKETSLFSKGLYSIPFQEKFTDTYSFNGSRVRTTFSLSEVTRFNKVLNAVLDTDETYFDFSSTNYYYALVGRKNPVYVNQSPLLLNGDWSQEKALEQIKQANVSLVLMPNKNTKWKTIDMIDSGFKYYLVSEYVHQNFVPLMNMNSFDIYVRKDKKKQYDAALKSKIGNANTIQLEDFSAIDQAKLQNHNVGAEITPEKTLLIKSTGDDPFMSGLLNQINGYDLMDKNSAVQITIKAWVTAAGTFQLYYQMPGDEGFTEEKSKRFTFEKVGENTLELQLPACPVDLRIDLETPEIILKQIQLVSSGGAGFQLPQTPNINLEELPRIWGEQADGDLFDKVPNLEEPLRQSSVTLVLNKAAQSKPHYLFVEADAATVQIVGIELFNAQNEQKGVYYFNTKPGKHRYAVRLSTDYYWWNGNLEKLSFSTSAAVTISKMALISSDGKNIQSYKTAALTLSNITDQNWQGGIGIGAQSNWLLIDNNKKNQARLNQGNYIELADGSKIKIDNKNTSGEFIRVLVSQNIEALKPKLQYPNNIKIVK